MLYKTKDLYEYELYGEIYKINIMVVTYDNNNTALIAETANSEPFAKFSINLEEKLPKNQIHIDNIENKGIIDYLIKNDLIKDKLVGTTTVNSWEYPIAELNMKKFNIDT